MFSAASSSAHCPPPASANTALLLPGQTITLKHYSVTVERHLSQGGFGHIYLVQTREPISGVTQHVLKHMQIHDDVTLQEVQSEISVMKVLRGHPNIVNLTDESIVIRQDGSHEVFILMEYCDGGCIIDLMNRKIRERLSESLVLKIFVDVCEAVAYMHSFDPPLIHRDIKVENVLQQGVALTGDGGGKFVVCDFGSTATPAVTQPSTHHEIRALEKDLNRHTTLQYRAPEMVDPYLRRPVNEKSDVWALGVFLYKLCYYATPFEGTSALPILSVSYTMPAYPAYSRNVKSLIASMLRDHGDARPTVAEILDTTHTIRGTKSMISCKKLQRHGLKIPMPRPVPHRVPSFRPDMKLVHSPHECPPIPHHVTSMAMAVHCPIQAQSGRCVPTIQIESPPVMPEPKRMGSVPVMLPPPTVVIAPPSPTTPITGHSVSYAVAWPPPSISQTLDTSTGAARRHYHIQQMSLSMLPPGPPPQLSPPPPPGISAPQGYSSKSTSHLPVLIPTDHGYRYLPVSPSPTSSTSSSSMSVPSRSSSRDSRLGTNVGGSTLSVGLAGMPAGAGPSSAGPDGRGRRPYQAWHKAATMVEGLNALRSAGRSQSHSSIVREPPLMNVPLGA